MFFQWAPDIASQFRVTAVGGSAALQSVIGEAVAFFQHIVDVVNFRSANPAAGRGASGERRVGLQALSAASRLSSQRLRRRA